MWHTSKHIYHPEDTHVSTHLRKPQCPPIFCLSSQLKHIPVYSIIGTSNVLSSFSSLRNNRTGEIVVFIYKFNMLCAQSLGSDIPYPFHLIECLWILSNQPGLTSKLLPFRSSKDCYVGRESAHTNDQVTHRFESPMYALCRCLYHQETMNRIVQLCWYSTTGRSTTRTLVNNCNWPSVDSLLSICWAFRDLQQIDSEIKCYKVIYTVSMKN